MRFLSSLHLGRAAGLAIVLATLAGCASGPATLDQTVTVQGTVSMRGAAPFGALVLETPDRNSYVLTPGASVALDGIQDAPSPTIEVTGPVYAGQWNGHPYAHLRVQDWRAVE